MKRERLLVVILAGAAGFAPACGYGGSGGAGGSSGSSTVASTGAGGGDAGPPMQTAACAMLLGCLSMDSPGAYAAALATYGPDGTCWKSTTVVAEQCDSACKSGLDGCASSVIVDTGATLSVQAGQGAGLFVEYAAGGHWRVFTSCDTVISGKPCDFDVVAKPAAGVTLSDAKGQGLDASDSLTQPASGSVVLSTRTDSGLDGATFTGTPGGAVLFDVRIGGAEQPMLLQWTSGGKIVQGASNPLLFFPGSP